MSIEKKIVYVEKPAYQKFRAYINHCPEEISGFGKIEERGSDLVITDFQIFDQVVGPAHSTMDQDGLAKFLFEKTKEGEDLSKWKVWWHSHARMNAFFSGTDTGTIDTSTEFPWLLSIVSNHDGETKARIDIHKPIRATQEVEIVILEEENNEIIELCKKEIQEKVRSTPVPTYRAYHSQDLLEDDGFEERGYWKNGKFHQHTKDKRWAGKKETTILPEDLE